MATESGENTYSEDAKFPMTESLPGDRIDDAIRNYSVTGKP